MTRKVAGKWWYRAGIVLVVVAISTVVAYSLARAVRGTVAQQPLSAAATQARADSMVQALFPSGRHLVAFMFVASDCGFCTEPQAAEAIRRLRRTLHASHATAFARVWVVGVAIGQDLDEELRYALSLQRADAVDEVSVGGLWLNEQVTRFVWRDASAAPEVPQVLLIARNVDASLYPRHIEVDEDSLLLRISGRDELISWVNAGAPLEFRTRR